MYGVYGLLVPYQPCSPGLRMGCLAGGPWIVPDLLAVDHPRSADLRSGLPKCGARVGHGFAVANQPLAAELRSE